MPSTNLAETGHFVNVIPPIDVTGGVAGDRFSMKGYKHATILLSVGVSAAAFTKIFVRSCSAATAGTATDIPYRLYAEETDAGDTLGAGESVAATGRTPSANNNILYVIELDSRELVDGQPWVEVAVTNGSNSVIASCIAILTGSRYAPNLSGTAIA
jgi:hypothetical protein